MGKLVLERFNMDGVADSAYSGGRFAQAAIVGLDVHSKPGVLRVAQKMSKDSGSTVTEFCEVAIACSNGESYWFSRSSGKIWRKSAAGAWSLAYTTTPSSGDAGCNGAYEFGGYVYWATAARLHRITIANALVSTWSTMDEDWQSLTDTAASYHPMTEVNKVLYIGDGSNVHQVEGGTYSATALDLPSEYDITCLGRYGLYLMIGTSISDNVNIARVFVWNTWGSSWDMDAEAPEAGVNAFLQLDNTIVVSVGEAGNLYTFSNGVLQLFRNVPGDYSPTATGFIRPNAVATYRGRAVFGFEHSAGAPSLSAGWVLGRTTNGYPVVLTTDFPISTGHLTQAKIGAILVIGNDLYMSWNDASAGSYGVDKLDWSAKCASSYMESMIQAPDRAEETNFMEFDVNYANLPVGADIDLHYKRLADASYQTDMDLVNDTTRKKFNKNLTLSSSSIQVKYVPTVSGNNAPEIENIVIRTGD